MRNSARVLCAPVTIVLAASFGCADKTQQQIDRAAAQVQRMAEQLDSRTTDTGTYVRVDPKDVKETDPWGTRLEVAYSQGGFAEDVTVRSAGPDREFHTDDDIQAVATSVNLKGVGTGIQQGVEKAAAGAAKGFVTGAVSGVKESLTRKRDGGETAPQRDPPQER